METELATRHNLPPQLTPFIGRTVEIAEITSLLDDPTCRLVTVVGLGGSGKTRLAVEVAVRKRGDFRNGVFFVPLQPLTSHENMVSAIAASVGYQFEPGSREPRQQLLDYFSHKSMLLIMDNFEHLLEGAGIVTDILNAAPHVKLLVTSREALNLQAEHLWPLRGLDTPPDDALDVFDDYSAVQFFVERTWRVRPDFSPGAYKHEIIRICRIVDGLPLALELAASWTRAVSPQAIGNEIQRSIDFLTTNQRDVPARHRSMRAVFDRSWSLLSEAEQRVFCKLSVFQGGFTTEAARRVTGASLPVLASLIDKSLLRLDASGRCDIHDLLRQYAGERLETAGDGNKVRDAHMHYYVDVLHKCEADLKGRRQLEALNESDVDFENVRAAWNWAVLHRQFDTVATALEGIALHCELRDRQQECLLLFKFAQHHLAPEPDLAPHPTWGQLLARTAWDMKEPQTQLETALQIARRHDNQRESAYCLRLLGVVAHRRQDYSRARQLLEQSLLQYRQLGDQYEVAEALWYLEIYDYYGTPAQRRQRFEECLRLRRDLGDKVGIAMSVGGIGVMEAELGHYREAERLFFERAALCQEMGNRHGLALGYAQLGLRIYFVAGQFDKARRFSEQALQIANDINVLDAAGWALTTLGLLACVEEDYIRGQDLCQQAAAGKVLAYISGFAALGLSMASLGMEDYETASQHLATALNYAVVKQNRVWMIACLAVGALLVAQRGQKERAIELLALSLTHPIRASGWMARWPLLNRLRASLENDWGSDTYAAVWARGKSLKLENTVTVLLTQFPFRQNGTKVETVSALAHSLTRRELEVLKWIAAGMSNQEIAQELVITHGTVKWYVSQIYEKLSVRSRTQAIARARELSVLP